MTNPHVHSAGLGDIAQSDTLRIKELEAKVAEAEKAKEEYQTKYLSDRLNTIKSIATAALWVLLVGVGVFFIVREVFKRSIPEGTVARANAEREARVFFDRTQSRPTQRVYCLAQGWRCSEGLRECRLPLSDTTFERTCCHATPAPYNPGCVPWPMVPRERPAAVIVTEPNDAGGP